MPILKESKTTEQTVEMACLHVKKQFKLKNIGKSDSVWWIYFNFGLTSTILKCYHEYQLWSFLYTLTCFWGSSISKGYVEPLLFIYISCMNKKFWRLFTPFVHPYCTILTLLILYNLLFYWFWLKAVNRAKGPSLLPCISATWRGKKFCDGIMICRKI